MEKKEYSVLTTLIIAIFAFGVVAFGLYLVEKKPTELKPPVVVQPSQYPDYDVIRGENKSENIKQLNITKDCLKGGCRNDKPASAEFDGINKTYLVSGKFSRAYLYIEAIVDYTRPLTSWDGIYFTMNNWGGHLVNDDNLLSVPSSDTSRILYNLRSISFYGTLEDKLNKTNLYSNINLFSLLQDTNILNIVVTISSDRPGRILREVSIYYECFEGSSCDIKEL